MVLVDTSVWIPFFRGEEKAYILKDMIVENSVMMHPYVFGELLIGGLSSVNEDLLSSLNVCDLIELNEVYTFIKANNQIIKGTGWVDISILLSIKKNNFDLMTFDSNLIRLGRKAGCKTI